MTKTRALLMTLAGVFVILASLGNDGCREPTRSVYTEQRKETGRP